MFWSTYKASMKNLARSVIFWFSFALILGHSVYRAMDIHYGDYHFSDNDPRFVLSQHAYVQFTGNVVRADILLYALPIFTVISAVLLLTRDHRDGFFEIEKAGGVKTSQYLLGRFSALLTVNVITALIAIFLTFHWYVFTRNGVDGAFADGVQFAELWRYLGDSTVRLMRNFMFMALPTIFMYIGWTYAIGTVFKSGFAGAVGGLGYVLLNYLFSYQLQFRIPEVYHDFLSPIPLKLFKYLVFYDSPWFLSQPEKSALAFEKAVISFTILIGAAAIWGMVSYWCTRRRKL